MIRHDEHLLQEQIVQYLRRCRCMPVDTDVMDGCKFVSGQPARIKYIAIHKRRGYVNGQPDLIVLMPGGKTLLAELKTKTGRQSAEQKEYQRAAESMGFEYVVWRSLGDCLDWFGKQGKNTEWKL